MKVVYLNVENQELPKVLDIEDNLDVFYELIGCRYIDIVHRKIGDKYFDVICDDEGTFKDKPVVSAVDTQFSTMLVGNLIISNNDGEGNLIDLSDEDIKQILRHSKTFFYAIKWRIYSVTNDLLNSKER